MPLHLPLPRIISHAHSRKRTDLCSTYAFTYQERQAQGYGSRSDWTAAIVQLRTMLWIAAEQYNPQHPRIVPGPIDDPDIDWNTWDVDAEIQDVRRFHFEDLDKTDQMLSTSHCNEIARLVARMESALNAGTLKKLEDVLGHLRAFREQALQLYGKKVCKATTSQMCIIPGALQWTL